MLVPSTRTGSYRTVIMMTSATSDMVRSRSQRYKPLLRTGQMSSRANLTAPKAARRAYHARPVAEPWLRHRLLLRCSRYQNRWSVQIVFFQHQGPLDHHFHLSTGG